MLTSSTHGLDRLETKCCREPVECVCVTVVSANREPLPTSVTLSVLGAELRLLRMEGLMLGERV